MYCVPIFRNILVIHLLRALYSDPHLKYFTSGTQEHFTPAPGDCISYQPHIALSAYLAESGRISAIAEISESIETLIHKHFNINLSMDKYLPLHISLFNIVVKISTTPLKKPPSSSANGKKKSEPSLD